KTSGLAAKVASDLGSVGFHTTVAGNSPSGSDRAHTIVRYGQTRADSAKTVAAAIPGATLKLDPSLGSGLQVLVGANYHGVQRVVVVAAGESGTVNHPRTAAQNICS